MTDSRTGLVKKFAAAKKYFIWYYFSHYIEIILAAEYPKSGGTWLCQMVADYLQIPFPRNKTARFEKSILHGHYLYRPSDKPIIHQIRDGRDVIVSLYHHMYFGNNVITSSVLHNFRKKAPFKDFENVQKNLPAFIEYIFTRFTISGKCVNWSTFINSYNNKKNVITVRYEDLLHDTANELARVISLLHNSKNPPDMQKIKVIVQQYSFESLSQRKRGVENKEHFLRKGVAGDWKNYFTQESCELFNDYAGAELILMGYEKDNSWVYENMI